MKIARDSDDHWTMVVAGMVGMAVIVVSSFSLMITIVNDDQQR